MNSIGPRGSGTFSSVLMALIVFFVVVPLGSCVACLVCAQIKREADKAKVASTASVTNEPALPSATTAPMPSDNGCSFAVFTGGGDEQLGVCTDVTDFSLPMPFADLLRLAAEDAGSKMAPQVRAMHTWGDVLRDDVHELQTGNLSTESGDWLGALGIKAKVAKGAVLLARKCGAMFSDRVELASCTTSEKFAFRDAGQVKIADVAMHFYNFDALSGDTALHGCLKKDGTWNALPRDSDEYKREKIREDLDRANRDFEKLRKVTQ